MVRVEAGWIPEVEWLEDGVRWAADGSNLVVTGVLVAGEIKGVRLEVERGSPEVSGLRKALWRQGVKAPARLRLARRNATGGVVIPGAVEVPRAYWNLANP